MGGREIIQLADEVFKVVNKGEFERSVENTNDGIHTIQSLEYVLDDESQSIRISGFNTPFPNNPAGNSTFNIKDGKRPFKYDKNNRRGRFGNSTMKMVM